MLSFCYRAAGEFLPGQREGRVGRERCVGRSRPGRYGRFVCRYLGLCIHICMYGWKTL